MASLMPKDNSYIFAFFGDQKLNKQQMLFKKIGEIAFIVAFSAQAIIYLLNVSEFYISDQLSSVLLNISALGFVVGMFMFFLITIYYLGHQANKTTFVSSLVYTLRKVAKYLFLPALIVSIPFMIMLFITIAVGS